MGRSRRSHVIADRPLSRVVSRPHPLAMRPTIIGVPVRRPHLLARVRPRPVHRMVIKVPGRPRVIRSVVVPRVALTVRRGRNMMALLSGRKNSPLKRRKLCKCHNDRSDRQRIQSKKFFGGFGSRGTVKQTHACAC